jgi:hypothetical protein
MRKAPEEQGFLKRSSTVMQTAQVAIAIAITLGTPLAVSWLKLNKAEWDLRELQRRHEQETSKLHSAHEKLVADYRQQGTNLQSVAVTMGKIETKLDLLMTRLNERREPSATYR